MRIRSRFATSIVTFVAMLCVISGLMLATQRRMERLHKQQNLATEIERGLVELSDLADSCLFYGDTSVLPRWESVFVSFSDNLARLRAETPEQLAVVGRMQDGQRRLQTALTDAVATLEGMAKSGNGGLDLEVLRDAWSNIAIQVHDLALDALQLSRVWDEAEDVADRANILLIFALIAAFGIYIIATFWLIYRRTLTSLAGLRAGTEIIGAGDLDFTLPEGQNDELGDLARAFNLMAVNLKTVTSSKAALEREIAEREKAEEARRRLAQFPEENPSPVLRIAGDGTLLYANRPALAWLGGCWNWHQGDGLPEPVAAFVADAFRQDQAVGAEIAGGADRIYWLEGVRPFGEDYVNLYGLDITERKRSEDALRESEGRYRTLFDTMTEGFALHEIITDDSGRPSDYRFLDINPAFERLTGLKRSEVVGRRVREVMPSLETRWIETYGQVALTGKPAHFEEYSADLRRWYEVLAYRVAPLRFAVILMDVTARKSIEEELHRSNENLGQFAYVASHDLQEPLRVMASYSQLLERRYRDRLDKDADEFIGFIVDAAVRMQNLITDLLTYSRTGHTADAVTDVDCARLVRRVIAGMPKATEAAGGAEVTYGDLPVVPGHEPSLMQLFQNLIGNALKFHGDKPPRIHVAAQRQGSFWVFSVKDNGIGIEPEYFEKIFTLFQRLHPRDQYPGTGMGLTICKKVVENHGGRIWVESEPGEGSTFYFTLPATARRRI